MCGRFTLRTPAGDWWELFFPGIAWQLLPESVRDSRPRYNIAPTQAVTCVLQESADESPQAAALRWGLVPPWADDLKIGNRMINARGETVDSKPSFKKAFAQRRCLVVADGYYEWKKTDHGKQPYLIEQPSGSPMAFAGLWEQNSKAAGNGTTIRTCTIITTSANETTKSVHERMPVILQEDSIDRWIDPNYRDTDQLKEMLVPCENERLQLTAVSTYVNSPSHDDPRCVTPS